MELSRRDALGALAAIGVSGGAVYYTQERGDGSSSAGSSEDSEALLETAAALAAVVYPSEVEGAGEFARTYVSGRVGDDEAYREAMVEAASALDARADEEYGAPFRELAAEDGDALLRDVGLEGVEPDPEGSERERIRFAERCRDANVDDRRFIDVRNGEKGDRKSVV